jgi:hypothetical protein
MDGDTLGVVEPLGLVSTPVELEPAPEAPLLVPLLEGAPSIMVLKFPPPPRFAASALGF